MALLEQVNQLKQRGVSDPEITTTLMEQGASPKEVQDALAQSNVKSAISQPQDQQMQAQDTNQQEQMQPSLTSPQTQQTGAPMPQEQTPSQDSNQQYADQQYQQPDQYQEGYDQGYDQTYYQQALDTETVRDIASQVVDEKLEKLKTDVHDIKKLKTETKFQIQSIENRLKKVEDLMQELQLAILKKIGQYGEDISTISKELQSTQDSFSKLVNPIIDNKRKTSSIEEPTSKKPKSSSKSRKKKDSMNFEDFLR